MLLTTSELSNFIARSDELGGPGAPACEAYWAGLEYRPDLIVDQSLDPFGEAYVEQQLALYREMSGRDFNQLTNEHTKLDVETHVAAINPYDHGAPGGLSMHVERLSRAMRLGDPPRGSQFLDMGCGWGLSSEIAAYTGVSVTAVDVNPDFVELVNRRAERMNLDIRAHHGSFDSFESDLRFSMILFYECFHHALRPWDLLKRMARHLTQEGRLVLAGEPINSLWWTHWGLRLDPLSVYCIRKFGWLESGWSAEFLVESFRRAGLSAVISNHPEAEIGFTVIGSFQPIATLGPLEIAACWSHSGWEVDEHYLANLGDGELTIVFPADARKAVLVIHNFRDRPTKLELRTGDTVVVRQTLSSGRNLVELDALPTPQPIAFQAETFVPAIEFGSGDHRSLSVHLETVSFF